MTRSNALLVAHVTALVVLSQVAAIRADDPDEFEGPPLTVVVSLEGDATKPRILDLEPNRTRIFKEMAGQAIELQSREEDEEDGVEVDITKTWIREVRVGKQLGKKQREELTLAADLQTEALRQKASVRFTLIGAGKLVWSHEQRIVLGLKGADIVFGGAFAPATVQKRGSMNLVVPLTQELREALTSDAKLEIYVRLVD